MKVKNLILGAFAIMSISACGSTGKSVEEETSKTSTKEEITYKYGFEEMYEKVWETKVIHNESVMMIEDDNGTFSGRLLFKPTRIIAVKSQSLEIDYEEGVDYTLVDDRIVLTENSKIPHFTKANCNMTEVPEGFTTANRYDGREDGSSIIFTEGSELLTRQIAVTYEHNDSWFGTVPQKKGDKFDLLRYKLNQSDDLCMVTIGDSIFCGCNTSGLFSIKPNQAPFPQGFANELERVYGSHITHYNLSVGGMLSNYGREHIMDVNEKFPDLVVIGFGMNDGSWKISPTDYIDNIEFMIRSIQANNPDCSIIVCATILASQVSPQADGRQKEYLPFLLELEDSYDGVAVLDMTTYSEDIQTKKGSLDLYSNNINHPCDWLARQYVANLMNLIEVNE